MEPVRSRFASPSALTCVEKIMAEAQLQLGPGPEAADAATTTTTADDALVPSAPVIEPLPAIPIVQHVDDATRRQLATSAAHADVLESSLRLLAYSLPGHKKPSSTAASVRQIVDALPTVAKVCWTRRCSGVARAQTNPARVVCRIGPS